VREIRTILIAMSFLFRKIYQKLFTSPFPIDLSFDHFQTTLVNVYQMERSIHQNDAAKLIQKSWRRYKIRILLANAEISYNELARAHNNHTFAKKLQAIVRAYIAKNRLLEMRDDWHSPLHFTILLQTRARTFLARRKISALRNAYACKLMRDERENIRAPIIRESPNVLDNLVASMASKVQPFVINTQVSVSSYPPERQAIYDAKPLLMFYRQPILGLKSALQVMQNYFVEFSAVSIKPNKHDELYIKRFNGVYSITDACIRVFNKTSQLEDVDVIHEAMHVLPPIMFNFTDFKRAELESLGFFFPTTIERALYTVQCRYTSVGPQYLFVKFTNQWTGFPIFSFIKFCDDELRRVKLSQSYKINSVWSGITANKVVVPLDFDLLPSLATPTNDNSTISSLSSTVNINDVSKLITHSLDENEIPTDSATIPPTTALSADLIDLTSIGDVGQLTSHDQSNDENDGWGLPHIMSEQPDAYVFDSGLFIEPIINDEVWLTGDIDRRPAKIVHYETDGTVLCANQNCRVQLFGPSIQKSLWREGLCGDCHGVIAQEKNTLRQRAQNDSTGSPNSRQERCRCWGNQKGICVKHGHKIYLLNGKCQNCI
jgi:hypothetical protein